MGSTITVNRGELASALAFAQLGLSKRPALPVLGGMRVTVSCGTLELAAFDYEITARAKVSGEASGPGSVLVSGAELAAVVKSLPKGRKVTALVTVGDDGMAVACDGTESVVSAMSAEEAAKDTPRSPPCRNCPGMSTVRRSRPPWHGSRHARDGTTRSPCCSASRSSSEAAELVMAATDRYRLGVDRAHWTGPDGVSALIPAVTLGRLAARSRASTARSRCTSPKGSRGSATALTR